MNLLNIMVGADDLMTSGADGAMKLLGKMSHGIVVAMSNVILGLWLYLWVSSTAQVLQTATQLLEVDAKQ